MDESPVIFNVPTAELVQAFEDGAVLTINRNEKSISRRLSVVRLGTLKLRSGRLIVGDFGMSFEMAEPLVRRVPPGEYDVLVSIWGLRRWGRWTSASDGMGNSPRVAYLGLRLSSHRATHYEFAATGNNDLNWTPSDAGDGFGVDVGGVGILDADDIRSVRDQVGEADHSAFVENAYSEHRECACLAGFVRLPTNPPVILPVAESGWGDGSYFSYWGLSDAGEATTLIVDFDLGNKWGWY